MRRTTFFGLAALTLLLAGCNQPQSPSANDDTKKGIDQLVAASKELGTTAKDIATSSKTTAEEVKALGGRVDTLERTMAQALDKQKRGAIYLTLDEDAACENDDKCVNTARAVCNRINYPNAITSKVNAGLRPTLHALVCFD